MKNTIKLDKNQLKWFWSWKSSRGTYKSPSGEIIGWPKPRCECRVRIGKHA